MKKFLIRSILGIFYGAFIAVVITNFIVLFNDQKILDGNLFLKNSLGSIFCGWLATVSPLYFENTRLRLSQQTGLHFLTIIVLYFILAFGIGWIPFDWKIFLMMLAVFLIFYIIIWLSFYLYFKNQAQKLNDELNSL